jgi:omega-hydroxy-beta-dihydromenaquinone-9 sulfotransferase
MLKKLRAAIQGSDLGYQIGLIGFVQVGSLVRLTHYAVAIHPRYLLRLGLVLGSSVLSAPLRVWEQLRYGRAIARVRLEEPPIFIVGHWRSGTTHLHNLMSQDPALGYVSMYQAMVPNASLVGGRWLKALLTRLVPLKRPMDNMVWPMDAPQEEEIPLAKLMPQSFYTRFLFPRKAGYLFKKYVLLEPASPRFTREFNRKYRQLLQVATWHAGGRRLVLKNPVNTARIRLLLELFPDAKFIHAYRSPYDVFSSTRHLHRKMLPLTTLQNIADDDKGEAVLSLYEQMMRRFFADRALIPEGNFTAVRFEDLERDPLGELRRVYEALDLPGHETAEPAFQAYVARQKDYRKNRLELTSDERQRIEGRWAFAFEALGYARSARTDAASGDAARQHDLSDVRA